MADHLISNKVLKKRYLNSRAPDSRFFLALNSIYFKFKTLKLRVMNRGYIDREIWVDRAVSV